MSLIRTAGDHVNIWGLREPMRYPLREAERIWREYGYDCVVTSGRDGKHSWGSLHYYGLAVDLRTQDHNEAQWPAAVRKEIAIYLQQALREYSKHYQVIAHDSHIHVEYDAGAFPRHGDLHA